MDKNRTITDLREERGEIRKQIHSLEADLEAIDRTIRRLSSNHKQLELDGTPVQSTNEQLSLTPATKHLISQFPKKVWTPTGLRNRLVEMREKGDLKSKTKDLLPACHTILDSLEHQGFLRKISKGRYKKA